MLSTSSTPIQDVKVVEDCLDCNGYNCWETGVHDDDQSAPQAVVDED